MDESRQFAQDLPKGFWEAYIKIHLEQWVKPEIVRWHVIRAEQFLKAHPDNTLDQITPEDITRYLEEAGRSTRLTDWQFRQVVDAIRTLFPYNTNTTDQGLVAGRRIR